ncbi:diaminopimelate epimerase [Chitinasiproducens palmae]|uniref:diaminopimelate epimerase n=1 Tax=Chitinasiproducens palmae TaxID=1770053 RepID=UPI0014806671|nr:diaminopimelate epimerase [Chitinasiproducens palmae]
MTIRFTKMQGAGNDFVVLDGTREPFALSPAQIRRLCDRHFGVGADQLLLVERSTRDEADFRYRIFNADGGEVEHCGNGARCFVKFVRDAGLTDKTTIVVEVMQGLITLTMRADGQVSVDMGAPVFAPPQVPFDQTGLTPRRDNDDDVWPLALDSGTVEVSVLSMGNPHAVQIVASAEQAPVAQTGPEIERHRRFPARVNAGFLEIVDRHTARLRVFERGAGETLACGTGACAAAVAGIRRGVLDSPVAVHTHGGVLTIAWDGRADPQASVLMTGPAVTVFAGEIDIV